MTGEILRDPVVGTQETLKPELHLVPDTQDRLSTTPFPRIADAELFEVAHNYPKELGVVLAKIAETEAYLKVFRSYLDPEVASVEPLESVLEKPRLDTLIYTYEERLKLLRIEAMGRQLDIDQYEADTTGLLAIR